MKLCSIPYVLQSYNEHDELCFVILRFEMFILSFCYTYQHVGFESEMLIHRYHYFT